MRNVQRPRISAIVPHVANARLARPGALFGKVGRHVHPLMQDADHVDQAGVRDAEEQEMRAHGQLQVTGADIVDGAASPTAIGQRLAGVANAEDVALRLVHAPLPGGVVPDLLEIGLGGGR